MNWKNKIWKEEDVNYCEKREVNNKQSRYIHHLSGGFKSKKMMKVVGYESLWGECLFYYCLELDKKTIRYYVQPVEVPVSVFIEKEKKIKKWIHIPDVLVFREGYNPHLFQIKGTDKTEETFAIDKACRDYSEKKGWVYSKIYPKKFPDVIKRNTVFLWNYLKQRKQTGVIIEEIFIKMEFLHEIKIIDLARSFASKYDYRLVLPVIYYLIGVGELRLDFTKPINQYSFVSIGSIYLDLTNYYDSEVPLCIFED